MEPKEALHSIEQVFSGKLVRTGPDQYDLVPLQEQNSPLVKSALVKEKAILENPCLVAAINYCRKGLSVIPFGATVRNKSDIEKWCYLKKWTSFQTKRATEGQIREWWATWPDALIGVVCGAVSGIVAIDADTPEEDALVQSMIPEGLTVPCCTTPRGGRHYIFKYRPGIRSQARNKTRKYELKSDGTVIILPPSKVSDGRGYKWI